MAVEIIKRPIGHVLDTTENAACIYNDYGDAIVFFAGHSLSTGDYVYIKSGVSTYNGFWYVVYNNGSSFYLRESPDASNLVSTVDTCDVIVYKSVLDHGYQCVHLPIIYNLRSNLWPTNESDTTRTISSIADDNGLCELTLSGSLGTFEALDYIKIDSPDFPDEVYQIISKTSSSIVTVNRVYASGLATGNDVILYYKNYNITCRIYGGLSLDHRFSVVKPYQLIASIGIVPDSNNEASINIASMLKEQMSVTENNTLSPYLPNNLDFYTKFYIEYFESYDKSDGSEVETFTSSVIADDTEFEGSAVNAILPFKNIHSGHLSQYIYADSNNLAKFLNLFDPVLFDGKYFDVSFLNVTPYVNSDAQSWTARSIDSNTWEWVTYGGGQFVAVSSSGTSRVATSPDGITWTPRTAASASSWQGVVWGNGRYVAVGNSGVCMWSLDGITWASGVSTGTTMQAVTYGNGLFCAVGNSGVIFTSPDGVFWTSRTSPVGSNLFGVTYGAGKFVAVGDVNVVLYSLDGITWASGTPGSGGSGGEIWTDVAYGSGVWVTVGLFGTNRVMSSTDGITWTTRTPVSSTTWISVTFSTSGSPLFVALASTGTTGMVSSDGETWTTITVVSGDWQAIAFGNRTFVAVKQSGASRAMTSIGSIQNTVKLKREVYINDELKEVFYDDLSNYDEGLYRKQIERSGWNEDRIDITLINDQAGSITELSETETITVNDSCSSQEIYLGWLNYLGGFEYWNFTARKDYVYEVEKSLITQKNIYTNWPNSYGEFANSVTKQIARESRKKIVVRSQFLTSAQLEGIKYIRFSPLVQVITDKYDVTNVVVDSGSFKTFTDAQDLNTIEFTISFTDQIPSQFE